MQIVQAERIELLDQLEQFPLKIRVKEDQDKILRYLPYCHMLTHARSYALLDMLCSFTTLSAK